MALPHQQLRDLSNFCAFYSVTGIFFMLWVWLLITHQPFYVGKIMHDVETYRNSAHGALWMFIATFTLSLGYLFYDANRNQVDAQIAESLSGAGVGGMHPLFGSHGSRYNLVRSTSHDSGSDDSHAYDEGESEAVVRPGPFGGCIRQRNPCFPDRDGGS